jgi:hypothetical protein
MALVFSYSPSKIYAQQPNNCTCIEPVIAGETSISTLVGQGTLPPNQAINLCIQVTTSLFIDQDYTFSRCEFIMLPGSQIYVQPGIRLTINDDSELHGCDRMWRGIFLMPGDRSTGTEGGIFDFENSMIRDAEDAVLANDLTIIRLVNNRFFNNFIGLRTRPGNLQFVRTLNNSADDIRQNTFSFETTFPYLKYFSYNDPIARPLAGIQLESTIFLFIGDDFSGGANQNFIYRTRWGIRLFNCTGIGLNSFEIIGLSGASVTPGAIDPVAQPNTGILMSGCSDINIMFNLIEKVRNGVVANSNTFGRIYLSNVIQAESFGIYGARNRGLSWGQQNSIISATCMREGGFMAEFDPVIGQYNGSVDFTDNNLTTTRDFGILYESSAGVLFLRNNQITSNMFDYRPIGIMLRNCRNVNGRVWENNIELPFLGPKFATGIRSENMFGTRIQDNIVKGNVPPGTFNYSISTGIAQTNSGRMRYCCNTVDNSNLGFNFNLANPGLRWFTTDFNNHSSGLVFGANATITKQLNTGNDWSGTNLNVDALYPGTSLAAQTNAPLKMDPSLMPNLNSFPMGWIDFLANNDALCSPTTCDGNNPLQDPDPNSLDDFDLRAFVPISTDADYVQASNHQSLLYQRMLTSANLTGQNSLADQFFADAQNGYIGALHQLKTGMLNLLSTPTTFLPTYQLANSSMSSGMSSGQLLFQNYQFAGTPAASQLALNALIDQLNILQTDYNTYWNLVNAIDNDLDNQRAQLLLENTALAPNHVSESNEQFINRFYIEFAGGHYPYEPAASDVQAIKQIANSCPEENGAAVLRARELIHTLTNESEIYSEQCSQSRSSTDRAKIQNSFTVTASPNPVQEIVYFHTDSQSEITQAQITNALGVIVASNLEISGSQARLKTTNLPAGVFFAELMNSSGQKTVIPFVKQ